MSDSEDPEVDDKRFKFVIVGDGAAGKVREVVRIVCYSSNILCIFKL